MQEKGKLSIYCLIPRIGLDNKYRASPFLNPKDRVTLVEQLIDGEKYDVRTLRENIGR